ncbi:uncharacterized protein LOC143282031 isoform X7 [Babylonia areolata]|uniref:uncharacterized protein LOC143282031 isoform X7 n=1 Tax=Babylonia areolata TaxID=304850 RepID=UPI003FD56BFB
MPVTLKTGERGKLVEEVETETVTTTTTTEILRYRHHEGTNPGHSRGPSEAKMETIWLQRSNTDIPWGFRLQGGRDYGVPLSVQKVTPGSVAAAGLCQGDSILKIGTISTTDLSHMEGQELIKRAGNILQLTIKKVPVQPMSPTGGMYGSQVTAQLHDVSSPMSPTSRGAMPYTPQHHQYQQQQQNHHHTYPATHTALPDGSTRIQIQRNTQAQPVSSGPPLPPTPKAYEENTPFSFSGGSDGGSRMPDYTIPYRHADPYRDASAGGPYGADDVYRPSQNAYTPAAGSSMSLPRGVGSYGDRRQQEPRSLPINLTHQPASPGPSAASSSSQPVKFNPTQAYESRIGSSRYPDPLDEITSAYPSSSSSAFSPSGGGPYQQHQHQLQQQQPLSPLSGGQQWSQPAYSKPEPYSEPSRPSVNSYASSPYSPQVQQQQQQQPSSYSRPQQTPLSPTSPSYPQQPPLQRGYSQEQPRGYYDSQSYADRPASPPQQVYQPRAQYQAPQQQQQYNSYGAKNAYGEPQPDPYSAPRPEAPPSYSQTFPRRQTSFERQMSSDRSQPSYNQYNNTNDGYVSNTIFNQQAGVSDFGYDESGGRGAPPPEPPRPQSYRPSVPQPYRPPEPAGVDSNAYDPYRRRESNPLSPGVRSVQPDFGRPGYSPQTSREYDGGRGGMGGDYGAAPPPPPPPAPSALASGASWAPPRRSSQSRSAEGEGQKVPDELLSTVLKSKGGGPKPFSYGVDLNELKKKIGPPTAPKTFRKKQSSPAGGQDTMDDYPTYSNKPAAGFVQSDYRRKHEGGPRAEIDSSPINVSMGTNPKKQSMSFKVLQWMTDTENTPDEPGQPGIAEVKNEPPPRSRRAQRDPTVHNAEDDEMRFSGLHSKSEIPSRSFKTLQKIPNEGSHNHAEEKGDGKEEEEERVGSYDETSIRYKGKHIPSPSFRVLQTWAETDPLDTTGQQEEEDDGLPDTLDPEEMTDRRYKGGHIPSKVFKHLQKTVGDDTPETPSQAEQQNGDATASRAAAKAPAHDVTATDF